MRRRHEIPAATYDMLRACAERDGGQRPRRYYEGAHYLRPDGSLTPWSDFPAEHRRVYSACLDTDPTLLDDSEGAFDAYHKHRWGGLFYPFWRLGLYNPLAPIPFDAWARYAGVVRGPDDPMRGGNLAALLNTMDTPENHHDLARFRAMRNAL